MGDVIDVAGSEYEVAVVEPHTDYSWWVEAWGPGGQGYMTIIIESDEQT